MYAGNPPTRTAPSSLKRDAHLVTSLLRNDIPTSEARIKSILMSDYGWTGERVEKAVNAAQARNLIRWVAFDGWYRGGRPL